MGGRVFLFLAAVGAPDERELYARRAEAPPVIDGRIDEREWRGAAQTTSFTQKFPREGHAPSEATTLRLLYDDQAIYVSFECSQRTAPIVARASRRDDPVLSDSVSFSLSSRGDDRSAFEFGVNVAGVLKDGLRYDDTLYSSEWDETWQASTSRSGNGWSAEFRIPLRVLRFDSAAEQSWGFQARRTIASRQEIIEWQLIRRLSGGEVSRYGRLKGLKDLGATSHWELRPFVLGRLDRLSGGASSGTGFEPRLSAGLDLKYQPSQGLTLDVTFNPDFAQVEADQALLNLSNVEQLLPEKRAFFLEGTEVFATPLLILYTRRIGRFPEDPSALGDSAFGEAYSRPKAPSVILGASKLTGRLGRGWAIGLLQALTAPNRVLVQSGGALVRRVVEPLSAYGVARLRHDWAGSSYLGVTLTTVQRLEGEEGYATLPRDREDFARGSDKLCPSGEIVAPEAACFSDAYVASLDWRYSSETQEWVTVGQLTQSLLREGPPRRIPDGTVVEPGHVGLGGYARLAKQGGKLVGDLTFLYADESLDYTDLGYAERSNLMSWRAKLEYRLPRVFPLIASTLQFEYLAERNTDAVDLGNRFYLGTTGKFSNLWGYGLYLHYFHRRFSDREVGNGLALERRAVVGVDLELESDQGRPVRIGTEAGYEWIEVAGNVYGAAKLTLNITPELALELKPELSYAFGEPRYVGEGLEPGEFIFGKLKAQSASLTLRMSYAFSPRLTLQSYSQLFLASGDYSSLSAFRGFQPSSPELRLSALEPFTMSLPYEPDFEELALNVNVVLRWEYLPGSTLFAVYTRSQELERNLEIGERSGASLSSLKHAPSQDTLLLKLGFWWGN